MSSNNSDFTDINCSQADKRICRYNRILEGINRILSNVVQAKTQEELGKACLSVALEITGSEFGFVSKIGADGLLHNIAINDMGWNRCLMYEKTGHIHPLEDSILHGLYGHVVDSGKSFFTNNPPSYPDSICLPEGHPLLTSFLGVPLVQDEKIIGVIAVANHAGGYSCEQQEDLEAITPAVTQVLGRKKEEKEFKLAENALRESEARYRHIVETAQEGIWLIDRNDRTIFVNKRLSEMLGYSTDEILGQSPQKFMPPEFSAKAESRRREQMHGVSHVIDYRFIRKDGSDLWCILSSDPLFDDQGKYTGSLAMITDITERKRAEEELRESEERLRLLSDNLPDSAVYQYVHEPDGNIRFQYFSAGLEKLNGIKVSDVLRDPGTLYRQVPQAYFDQLIKAEARSARELSDFDMELPIAVRW